MKNVFKKTNKPKTIVIIPLDYFPIGQSSHLLLVCEYEQATHSISSASPRFCQFSLRSCIFGFPASLLHPNMFISNCPSPFTTCFYQLFSQSTTKQREESLAACGGLTQPGTLSMNFSSSPSPSVIDKQSFPYALEGVVALTEEGML